MLTFLQKYCIFVFMEFKVGDIVYLKSNPESPMTVSLVIGKTPIHKSLAKMLWKNWLKYGFVDGDVQCTWFEGTKRVTDYFKNELLAKKD